MWLLNVASVVVALWTLAWITKYYVAITTVPSKCLFRFFILLFVYFSVFISRLTPFEPQSTDVPVTAVWKSVCVITSGIFFHSKDVGCAERESFFSPLFFRDAPQWWCSLTIVHAGLQWMIYWVDQLMDGPDLIFKKILLSGHGKSSHDDRGVIFEF